MAEFNPARPQWSNSILRVKILFRLNTFVETYQCTMHYRPDSIETFATVTTLAQFSADWRSTTLVSFQGCLPVDSHIQAVLVDDLSNPALHTDEEVLIGVPGLVVNDFMPPFVQTTIRFDTSIRGKKGRGRIQMPLVPENFYDGGLLNATGGPLYAALRDDLLEPIQTTSPADDWRLCIATRDELGADGRYTTRVALVTSATIRETAGTQDRRKYGRGS